MEAWGLPHRKRCKRWDVEFDAHFLTFSCFQRRPFLTSPRACRWFLEAVNAARQKQPFDLWAFVLMPEHVHLILWPRDGSRISPILKAMKLPVSNRVRLWVREHSPEFLEQMAERRPNGTVSYRFWQRGGGYDRNLRDDRELYKKLHYVHNNPVTRELVARAGDWQWSSFRAHAFGDNAPITLNLESMPLPPLT
ncbi:MAG: REP-associated tyrosine transposase [Planctomycetota bacterium]